MNYLEKIAQLKSIIETQLSPLIDRDYYLLEVPYYTNIGDTLIWQGEMDFLSSFSHHCLGMYSLESFPNLSLTPNTLVLFQGGGNFGDLWPKHHDFKIQIIKDNPECKFVFFPQTVWFDSENKLTECATFLSKYDVTICARDFRSYEVLKSCFSNNIIMVPDMAFCINMSLWNHKIIASKPLLLKRTDSEYKANPLIHDIESIPNIVVSDWPTMCGSVSFMTRLMKLLKGRWGKKLNLIDKFVLKYYRPYLIRTGVEFLNSHTHIYTTRLHAAILGILLGKDISFLDNSYGKNSTFYRTWLYDCENIVMI